MTKDRTVVSWGLHTNIISCLDYWSNNSDPTLIAQSITVQPNPSFKSVRAPASSSLQNMHPSEGWCFGSSLSTLIAHPDKHTPFFLVALYLIASSSTSRYMCVCLIIIFSKHFYLSSGKCSLRTPWLWISSSAWVCIGWTSLESQKISSHPCVLCALHLWFMWTSPLYAGCWHFAFLLHDCVTSPRMCYHALGNVH